jgi:hypothetical protein
VKELATSGTSGADQSKTLQVPGNAFAELEAIRARGRQLYLKARQLRIQPSVPDKSAETGTDNPLSDRGTEFDDET